MNCSEISAASRTGHGRLIVLALIVVTVFSVAPITSTLRAAAACNELSIPSLGLQRCVVGGAARNRRRQRRSLLVVVEQQRVVARGIPKNAALAVNVTSVEPSADGYVSVWDCAKPQPPTPVQNPRRSEAVASQTVVSSGGEICVMSATPAHMVVDLVGAWVR